MEIRQERLEQQLREITRLLERIADALAPDSASTSSVRRDAVYKPRHAAI